MQELILEKPMIFFDLETTGTSVAKDRIVEMSVIKIMPDGKKIIKTLLVNPEMPIPSGASEVHGITDAKVADAPAFSVIASNLMKYFDGCDLAGYNILKFDIPMLVNEFKRCGMEFSMEGRRVVDVFNIFCKLFPRTLTAAYKLFCGKELEGAHGAEADTLATIEVLLGQLKQHEELPRDVEGLHDFSDMSDPDAIDKAGRFKWSGDEAIVAFGKNSGMPLRDMAVNNPGFFKWILNADFDEDTKAVAAKALRGEFPEREENAEKD
ncbi:3'-5' exonuclease [Lentisphaerota bacterium ZTH]|nr:3'-5' exonuclease [Lentisphaerota bacterium]WET06737.1 3'-5' exonuclease [Lentisphaerota bacterium ZTH]